MDFVGDSTDSSCFQYRRFAGWGSSCINYTNKTNILDVSILCSFIHSNNNFLSHCMRILQHRRNIPGHPNKFGIFNPSSTVRKDINSMSCLPGDMVCWGLRKCTPALYYRRVGLLHTLQSCRSWFLCQIKFLRGKSHIILL